jgi:hypothetical protein
MRKFLKHATGKPKGKPDHGARRHVGVDVDLVALEGGTSVDVDLFDGNTTTLDLERVEQRDNGFTWHGKHGKAVISVVGDTISGTILDGDTQYQVQTQADGSTLLREIDPALFPPDHPPP